MPGPVSVLSMCGAHAGLPELLIMMFFLRRKHKGADAGGLYCEFDFTFCKVPTD